MPAAGLPPFSGAWRLPMISSVKKITRLALPLAGLSIAAHATALLTPSTALPWGDRIGWTLSALVGAGAALAAARSLQRLRGAGEWWLTAAAACAWLVGALLRDAAPLAGGAALTAADAVWCLAPLLGLAALALTLPSGWRGLSGFAVDALPLALGAAALSSMLTHGGGELLTMLYPAVWTLLALASLQTTARAGFHRAPAPLWLGTGALWMMAASAFLWPPLDVWDGGGGPAALLWSLALLFVASAAVLQVRRPEERPRQLGGDGSLSTLVPVSVTVVFALLSLIGDGANRTLLYALALLCFAAFSARLTLLRRSSQRLLGELSSSRAALAASEGRLRAMFDAGRIGIAATDPDGRILEANPAFARMLGHESGELIGLSLASFSHPDDAAWSADLMRRAVAGETDGYVLEKRYLRKDGSVLHAQVSVSILRDEAGAPFAIGMLEDISERKHAEGELRAAEERYRSLVEELPLVTYVDALDELSSAVYMSPQVEPMLGYSVSEWLEQPDLFVRLLHPDDRERVLAEHLRTLADGGKWVCEYRLLARDGRVVWVRDESVPVTTADGLRHAQGYLLDITARKRAEAQLQHLAYHDGLTGLPNRALFEEHLDLALSRARREGGSVAVLYIDLDEFKLVNDSLGHSAGDELLREAARRLAQAMRQSDVVARQGGDEFLVLVADLDAETDAAAVAAAVGEQIGAALAAPFRLGETEVSIGASVGISTFSDGAGDAESLLKQADIAMYQAKQHGRDGHRFHARTTGDAHEQLSLVNRLRRAVEQGEFVLHYQPIVDLAVGRVAGVEALIRWQDGERGLIAPAEFIPVAERTGLIRPITDWLIEEVCRQAARWQAAGLALPVSLNVPVVLCDRRLAARLQAAALHNGIDPRRLTVELTESTVMAAGGVEPVLEDLHQGGIGLALDDFGTGYSSLARLRHLPLSTLKIDRSFVRDASAGGDADVLVTTIIHLARNLGLKPLAEGIETEEQWQLLLQAGCVLGQGYLFSRPVPAEQIEAMVRRPPWMHETLAA